MRCPVRLLALAVAWLGGVAATRAAPVTQEVLADAPRDLAVTVYRDPSREAGGMQLEYLGGFALIRETRTVRLPAGLSRVRFEGVADGIEPVSAIVTGLTQGVIEKNLDARLLSPATLLAAASSKPVTLLRTNARTGRAERVRGVILTGAQSDGVVFKSQDTIEALRCSGLAEGLAFTDVSGLSASPTLSVAVRTRQPTTQQLQLSYLAYGFDWSADYTATLSEDGKHLDLGAWVTLANGNGVSFPQAHTQIVAGRLNREGGPVEAIDAGGPVLAQCWPQGRTSDPAELLQLERAVPLGFVPVPYYARGANRDMAVASPMALMEVSVTGARVRQEQLGDLKLYRVPQRTTVASRQSKQVRLLDRTSIPVQRIYRAQVGRSGAASAWSPAAILLRTRNTTANHLGLPLPSGQVSVFQLRDGTPLLLHQADLRDLALDEEVEIDLGTSADVQVQVVADSTTMDPSRARTIPLVPGVLSIRDAAVDVAQHVEVSNARATGIAFELALDLGGRARVVRADHKVEEKNGNPIFRFTVPANGTVTVRYQTAHSQLRAVPP